MHTTTVRRLAATGALVTAATAALVGAAATSSAASAGNGNGNGNGRSELATVRAATAKYHDVEAARADGYVPVSGCEQLPGAGAMGIHYLNPRLAGDLAVDPTTPEVLLYVPTSDGLRLVGVEYFVADAGQQPRPDALGRGLDGPMAGHSPQMPAHYDLHVWLWKHNPAGTFAAFNPALSCAQ